MTTSFEQTVNDYTFEWITEELRETVSYDNLLKGVIEYAKSLAADLYKDQECNLSDVAKFVSSCVAQMQVDGLISVAELSCGNVIFDPSENPIDVFQKWMVEIVHSSGMSLGYFHDKQASHLIDALNQICPGSFRGTRRGLVVYPESERIYLDLVASFPSFPSRDELYHSIGSDVVIPASELCGFFDMIIEKLKKEQHEKFREK